MMTVVNAPQPLQADRRQRIEILDPKASDPASIWASVANKDGKTLVTLDRKYPDLAPVPGWVVQVDGQSLVIETVVGVVLACAAGS